MLTTALTLIAFATLNQQAASVPSPEPTPVKATIVGCVAGGGSTAPFTVLNPTVAPGGTGPVRPGASTAPAAPDLSGVAATGRASNTAGAVGTSGTSSASAGNSDRSSGAAGTPGSGATNAADLAASNQVRGYRLTGPNLAAWSGRRVQIVGSVVPATPTTWTPANASGTATPAQAWSEFRVENVQAAAGNCP